ncbi:hypothetical protein [Teichococcus vastitatis]|uniref:hypothetical protein n=1 Tax=Teichococcus vastitatis TaxID=2307076 RepID=UPI0013004FBD|nr:hypothetical protein [Pseudoroseomonas vastitatis]
MKNNKVNQEVRVRIEMRDLSIRCRMREEFITTLQGLIMRGNLQKIRALAGMEHYEECDTLQSMRQDLRKQHDQLSELQTAEQKRLVLLNAVVEEHEKKGTDILIARMTHGID